MLLAVIACNAYIVVAVVTAVIVAGDAKSKRCARDFFIVAAVGTIVIVCDSVLAPHLCGDQPGYRLIVRVLSMVTYSILFVAWALSGGGILVPVPILLLARGRESTLRFLAENWDFLASEKGGRSWRAAAISICLGYVILGIFILALAFLLPLVLEWHFHR